jgi:putative ABC transport system permease protein
MFKNFIQLFVRNLQRQKLFSLINLLGLSVSITSTLLIYLYVRHEFSYDDFHPHTNRLYRVNQTFIWGENSDNHFSRTGPGVAHAMKEEFPEVELITSLHTPGSFIVSYTNPQREVKTFEETEIFSADSNFFKVFNFPLLMGDEHSAFKNSNTLMMTRSTAEKYFGKEDPLGKLVRLGIPNDDKTETYEVTGVIEDVPTNSTIQFDVLLSSKNFEIEKRHWSWVWTQLETFVLLSESADINNVRAKLATIPAKRAEETLQRVMNITYDEYVKSGKKWELFLQPITSLHLPDHTVVGSFPDTGNIKVIYSLIGAAIFIVLLSCINFMNLSTAQFTRRVKEASVRKILGLSKTELGAGYFYEAMLFCFIGLAAAIALTELLLPYFNLVTGKTLELRLFSSPTLLLGVLGGVILMALVSSFYPAVFLSSFRPVEAIKGKIKPGKQGKSFRNGLVVFQFSVSIVLIICTAVVFQQLKYVSEKDLGFDKENVVQLNHAEAAKNAKSLVQAMASLPHVVHASRCSSTPPSIFGGDKFTAEGLNGENFSLNYTSADENFIPTLAIRLKYGRNFSEQNPSDVNSVIINEATIKRIGWKDDDSVIGRKINYPNSNSIDFEIIGVVSDFNYWSLANSIEPMGIFHIDNPNIFHGGKRFVALRIDTKDKEGWNQLSSEIASTWKQHAGDAPFDYGFIDDYFTDTFKSQQKFGLVLVIIAGLAILIASLGLLGMIIYSLEQRTKEIGIRKVSGASVWNILTLISSGYFRLIVAAFVIAAPISYFMMKDWLEDFEYRISPSPWIFLSTGFLVLLIASLITSYHSLKAATTNPVDALKDE